MSLIDKETCEEAVLSWYNGDSSPQISARERSLKAKQHLSAMGWVFFRTPKNGREELRYQSPSGKVFYSLKTACKHYIEQKGSRKRQGTAVAAGGTVVAAGDLNPKQPMKRKQSCLIVENHEEGSRRGQGTEVAAGDLNPKQPKKRKQNCLIVESHELSTETQQQQQQPKRGRKPKKQKNPTKPRVVSCKRVRKCPLSKPCHRNPKTVLSWLIDNKVVSLLAKVYYRSKSGSQLRTGRLNRTGINCDCCYKSYTLTAFEVHAGSTNHRPSANIILDDGSGRSLSDCQKKICVSTMNKAESRPKTVEEDDNSFQQKNDEVCSACRIGGDLILCDNCPSAYHVNCLGLMGVPDGKWFCPSCCCGICYIGNSNNRNFLICRQCDQKYHLGCFSVSKGMEISPNPWEIWFCGHSCENIYFGLRKLVGKPIPSGNNLTWTLLNSEVFSDNLNASAENHSKLSVALEVMHECFEPAKDLYTGRDLVEDVIFSRESELKRLNFKEFHTVILEENDEMVSVATVRVHDSVAEIPFVATRFSHRRRGMCRVLMDELEKNLVNLGVQKLILPALPGVVDTWTNNFGFSHMTEKERSELLRYTFLDFQETIMCQKVLMPS